MKKLGILSVLTAAIALSASGVQAEECKVVNKEGKGLIKAGMGESGTNEAGDPEATIMVPDGQCEKINAGDFEGVSNEIKEKIEGAA